MTSGKNKFLILIDFNLNSHKVVVAMYCIGQDPRLYIETEHIGPVDKIILSN